MIDNNN